MAEVLNTSELEDIFKTVEGNTKVLADSSLTVEQCGLSLELVQVLLAGSFAFTLLDRIPGGSLNAGMPEWVETAFAKAIIDVPLLFFVLNMIWMAGCIYALIWFKKKKSHEVEFGRRTLRIKVNKPIDIEKFELFLGTRVLDKQESVSQLASEVRRVVWKDLGLQACSDERAHPSRSVAFLKGDSLSWKHKLKYFVTKALGKRKARKARDATGTTGTLAGNSVSPLNTGAAAGILEPGIPVEVEVEYDSRYGFLLFVSFHFHVREKEIPIAQRWRNYVAQLKERFYHEGRTASKLKRMVDDCACPRNETLIMEQELMNWFSMEMKQHGVIKNVDLFLSA
jgi:hypothetical protein